MAVLFFQKYLRVKNVLFMKNLQKHFVVWSLRWKMSKWAFRQFYRLLHLKTFIVLYTTKLERKPLILNLVRTCKKCKSCRKTCKTEQDVLTDIFKCNKNTRFKFYQNISIKKRFNKIFLHFRITTASYW